jgi:hypothetical protein
MALGRTGHTATLLADGRVLVVGGNDDPTAELFDPVAGTFTEAGRSTALDGHAAVRLHDGRVFLFGGSSRKGERRAATLFDPATGAFTDTAEAISSDEPALVPLEDGRVVIIGGWTDDDWASPPIQVYDPATDSYSVSDPLPGLRPLLEKGSCGSSDWPRAGVVAAALVDGRVLVAGGAAKRAGCKGPIPIADVMIYDPSSGRSSVIDPMAEARYLATADVLRDGRVIIAGGVPYVSDKPASLRTATLFDPVQERFSAVVPMTEPRSAAASARLDDGRVLITGGASAVGPLETAELFR